jgi:hypothetical protein
VVRLGITGSAVGSEAAHSLGRALAAQGADGALRELDLRGDSIGLASVTALARGLSMCLSLDQLDIANNGIGPPGARAIAAAISGTGALASKLRRLNLRGNAIGDEGALAMVEGGLGRNSSLTLLDVGDNGLRDAGYLALVGWAVGRVLSPPRDVLVPLGPSVAAAALPGPASSTGGLVPLKVCFGEEYHEQEVSGAVKASIRLIAVNVNSAVGAAGWHRGAPGPALAFCIPSGRYNDEDEGDDDEDEGDDGSDEGDGGSDWCGSRAVATIGGWV